MPRNLSQWLAKIPCANGAGTILEQGGQDQVRQSLERKIRFFAGIGLFFVPKQAFSKIKKIKIKKLKKNKGFRRIWSVSLTQKQAFSKKKVFAGYGVFFNPKMAQDTSMRGAKVVQGCQNISRGGSCPPAPYFPRLCPAQSLK